MPKVTLPRVALLVGVGCVACAGCTLLTSLEGLSGGADAATDPAAETGTTTTDATADTSMTVEAGAGCAALGQHAFCADFDTAGSLTDGWDRFRIAPGTGALDTALFSSPPRSAMLRIAASSPGCTYAKLEKNFAGTFGKATLAFDMRVGSPSGAIPSEAMSVAGIGIGGKCAAFVYPYGSMPFVYRQDDPSGNSGQALALQSAVSVGAWHRVSLTFSTTSSPYIVVQGDGVTLGTITTLPAACQIRGAVGIGVGFHCAKSLSPDLEMRADNIVADFE